MSRLRTIGAAALAVGLSAITGATAPPPSQAVPQQWIELFNGRDLEGWTPKITGYAPGVNFGDTFRVESGLIRVAYDQYGEFQGRFGHLFYEERFSHYRLRVEYRFVGDQAPGGPDWALRNSGVMLHGERPEEMTVDQEFPTSIELQFLGGNGTDERPTSNLCTPGTNVVIGNELVTRHCTNARSKTYHGDQWVTAEVEVCGNRTIRHFLDGQVVLEYSSPQLDERDPHAKTLADRAGTIMLDSGTISLQSESHPVEFRRVELLPLTPESCGG